MTMTITIKDKYIETLRDLGNVQEAVELALQRYAIECLTTKISTLRQQEEHYQQRYQSDYPTFVQRIATDETFVQHLETDINKLWEIEMAEWEFCYQGIRDWTQRLQDILLT